MNRPKLKMLQPRIKMAPTFAESRGLKMAPPVRVSKTLKQRQAETGRTLALNGAAWRRLRASVLASEPLCRQCVREGRTVPATDVDHRDNDPTNNELLNLVPLCASCHSRKTQADMGKKVAWGCDAGGLPLDPAHPWNDAATARPAARIRCGLRTEITGG